MTTDQGFRISEPYGAKRTGWSGTDTSKDAERRRAMMQKPIYAFVKNRGYAGATRAEACLRFANDGGSVSGALSAMHRMGVLARLTEKRDKQKVYVHPDYVDGRDTEAPGSNRPKTCPHCGGDL